jgi:hypothetical protein
MVIALALVFFLSILVAATQLQVVTQLAASRTERDYERALQMAEAGGNAYLNVLSNGGATGAVPAASAALLPPVTPANAPNSIITLNAFRHGVKDGTYPLTRYPAGSQQGYYVYPIATGNAAFVEVVSYGWSNGVARRVRFSASSFSIFDWAALYGLNPDTGNGPTAYAWKFSGGASVVGASGGEGKWLGNNNATFYEGPIIWANGSYAAPYNNADPPLLQSGANVPTGHPDGSVYPEHSHPDPVPLYRHYARKLDLPTADEQANAYSGTASGVAHFRNSNHNATGLRLLVRNPTTGVTRALPGSYEIVPSTGNNAYQLDWPTSQFYTQNGMVAGETPLGIRAYPGHYFFTKINMQPSDRLYLRTFSDAERSTIAVDPARVDRRLLMVEGDPANPNSGQAGNQEVRFWMGHVTNGSDPNSTFTYQTFMEYPRYASRFRTYNASRGTLVVKGTNDNPPPPFRINLLAYNKDGSGSYGSVQFQSSVYLYGSLIGWQVDVAGGCTIEKEATEVGPSDKLTYVVTEWTELP